jgi:hypothetical protein
MFKNTFQSGFLSILYSIGSKPLQIWDKQVRNGHIKRITDQDIQSSVLEIMGTNVSTNHITCPADKNKTLGIKLPFLVMIIKNVSPAHRRSVPAPPRARGAGATRPCARVSCVLCWCARWMARSPRPGWQTCGRVPAAPAPGMHGSACSGVRVTSPGARICVGTL